jgi:hypothetical protein
MLLSDGANITISDPTTVIIELNYCSTEMEYDPQA